jgi:Ca-activated chloride channel family protein
LKCARPGHQFRSLVNARPQKNVALVERLAPIINGKAGLLLVHVGPLLVEFKVFERQAVASGETLTLILRYKPPEANASLQLSTVVKDSGQVYAEADRDFKFAAAVAAFGLVLRDSEFKGSTTLAGVLELAQEGRGPDEGGYRAEFIELVKKARGIAGK